MKKYLLMAVACMALLTVQAQKQLVILHSNDTHSCVMPLSEHLADTAIAGRGGFLRRVEMIRQERQKHPDLLYFDSGDFSQGSPYYSIFKGDVEIELMNRMGCDASTVGNHEFDFGMENMARIFKKAKFPILCSNYDFTGTPLEGVVKPYTIIHRNGLKLGYRRRRRPTNDRGVAQHRFGVGRTFAHVFREATLCQQSRWSACACKSKWQERHLCGQNCAEGGEKVKRRTGRKA